MGYGPVRRFNRDDEDAVGLFKWLEVDGTRTKGRFTEDMLKEWCRKNRKFVKGYGAAKMSFGQNQEAVETDPLPLPEQPGDD